jgi:nucleotide-binding universal stress UspA family protein
MTTWKTILVPHDFSASADRAVAIAAEEARLRGAHVVLLHVVELVPHFGPDLTMMVAPGTTEPVSVRRYYMDVAEAELKVIADQLTTDGVATTVVVRSGIPVDEIRQLVGEQPIDVIVMGTHGRTGLRHLIMGSVAERVLRTSSVPVLTIREPDPE